MGNKRNLETAHLVVTKRCNMRCRYCYNDVLNDRPEGKDMSLETFLKVMDLLTFFNVKRINLTGGEPFLNKNIEEFISVAHKKGVDVSATTNAMLLNKDWMEECKRAGLDGLAISIDSLNVTMHENVRLGSKLDYTVEMLKYAKDKLGLVISITCVLTNINYLEIERLILFSIREKIILNIQPVFDKVDGKQGKLSQFDTSGDEWNKFCRIFKIWGKYYQVLDYVDTIITYFETGDVKEQSCNVKEKILVVYPNGEVFPCFFNMDMCLGNAATTAAPSIEEKYQEIDFDTCYHEECISCGYKWE